MPPRLMLYRASRSLAVRTRPSIAQPRVLPAAQRRCFAEEKQPRSGTDPNQDVIGSGSVSEEAAEIGRVTGETQPDIGQGTPVQEILKRDQEGKDKAPEVIKQEIGEKKALDSTSFAHLMALGQLENVSSGGGVSDPVTMGHKFGLPNLPIPSEHNMKHRYDEVVTQVTNLLMKDGKKSIAQRNMSFILNHLRTAPPPTTNPNRPLIPGSPPASYLPLNPVLYLTVAIDSVAPLLRIRSLKGAAGGGASLPIPTPLSIRQRRRQAFQWILDAAVKKTARGSGRGQFAQKVAEELVSVVEGRSSAWDRRGLVHKSATSARANLNYKAKRR